MTTLDLHEMTSRIVTQLVGQFGNLLAGVMLYDEYKQEFVSYAFAGRGVGLIRKGARIPLGKGMIGQAGLTRRTQLSNNTSQHPHFVPLPGLDVRAEVVVPIMREDKLLAVFVMDSEEEEAFRPDDVLLLETLAAQLAPVIENAWLFGQLSASYDHTLHALVAALDARDRETEGHSRRVVAYSLAIAAKMGLTDSEVAVLQRGALLHDIGKIGVPDAILHKPGPLDEPEWEIMRQHPEWGERILAGIPFLEEAKKIVRAHQERWDGRGYPDGLTGQAIPLSARIFAVADTLVHRQR